MIDEDELRTRLRSSAGRLPASPPALDRVARRARRVRFRRWSGGLLATVIAATGVVVPLVLLSPFHGNTGRGPLPVGSPGSIDRFGIHVTLSDGWDGRLVQLDGGTRYLQASSFPLTGDATSFLSDTRSSMGPEDATIQLAELPYCPCAGFEPTTVPFALVRSDFGGSFEGVAQDHAFARRTFEASGRWFDLWVEFGTKPAPSASLDQVNAILATLRVDPASGWQQHSDQDDAVSLWTPSSWTFTEDPVPNVDEPKILFAAGTYDFPAGGDCGPEPALKALPDDGALVWLTEFRVPQNPSDFPIRPNTFRLEGEPVVVECSTSTPQYLIRFRDGFRFFQFQVALGPHAPDGLRQDVIDVLDSLSEGPLPEQDARDRWLALCDRMSWVLCPFSDWVRDTIWDAGFAVRNPADGAIVAGADGNQFLMWAGAVGSEPQALDPARTSLVTTVDGITVRSDGTRAEWQLRGIELWIAAGPDAADTLPSTDVIAALVRASEKERIS